jgi:hypothetical protein
MTSNKTISVLTWKDSLSLNFPSGRRVDLRCAHVKEGEWGINIKGEIIPTATATVPVSEPGTQFQKDTLGISAGKAYTDINHFTDANFKACVRVKELETNNVYYVDKTSYDAAIAGCNTCCTTTCVAPAPEVTAGPASTTATVAWTGISNVVGYEWVATAHVGACPDPTGDGTFTQERSVNLTGLTPITAYCFAVRSICGAGIFSDWAFVQFTTTA